MNLKQRWYLYWNPPTREYDEVEIWVLRIRTLDHESKRIQNPNFRILWKIYSWYLTKDSEKYNIEYKNGMSVLLRRNVEHMSLEKKIKREYKENNDET